MASPFDYTNSFNKTKKPIIDNLELFEKEYSPFIINRIIANNPALVEFAAVMNENPSLDKKIQHDWYMTAIPKNNTYTPYIKKDKSINTDESMIQFVQDDAKVSFQRALEIIEILGETFIKGLIEKRGGVSKWKNKNNTSKSES